MPRYLVKLLIMFGITLLIASSCRQGTTPRPKGYFRIGFPEKEYVRLDSVMPYSILYPKYAHIETDISPADEPYWINLSFPDFNAKIHVTYIRVDNNIYEILEDNIQFAYNHAVKADDIIENIFVDDEYNVFGNIFEIKGNVASPVQFFATDSAKHFIRGSLYFNTVPNKDSLAPVIDFITEDVYHLMENIRWKN